MNKKFQIVGLFIVLLVVVMVIASAAIFSSINATRADNPTAAPINVAVRFSGGAEKWDSAAAISAYQASQFSRR